MTLDTLQREVVRGAREFVDAGVMSLAAAIAFYGALSLAPAVLLILGAAGALWDEQPLREELVRQVELQIGHDEAELVDSVVAAASKAGSGGPTTAAIGLAVLLFAATSSFVQLQYALNRIWGVRVRRGRVRSLWLLVRSRLVSLGLIVSTGLLLVVSLLASSVASFVASRVDLEMRAAALAWQSWSFAVSVAVFAAVFAALFKILPDARVAWRDVWIGATGTALLFAVGKELIGLYLGRSALASAYGAAGSLVVVLLWVYYAALILLAGAKCTQVLARVRGRRLEPKPHAERWSGVA